MLGVLALEDQQEPVPLPVEGAFSIRVKAQVLTKRSMQ